MSTLETRIAEVLAAHSYHIEPDYMRAVSTIVCNCGNRYGLGESHRAHQAAALAPAIADVYDDGRRAGVATHEHGKKGCFFDLANQPNPYRPS